jgi:hypothetical protein
VVVVYAAAAAVVATAWPLAAYTVSLAAFGLGHVLTEVRYVDARFGRALPQAFWRATGAALGAVVLLRVLGIGGVIPASTTAPFELGLAALLFAIAASVAWRSRASTTSNARTVVVAVVAGLVAVAVMVGAVVAPVPSLLLFAVLHNATPMLFLVERALPGRRVVVAVATLALFVGVPALVATGVPQAVLGGFVDVDAAPWRVGVLADHYSVYLPRSWKAEATAAPLFSAVVTAQLLHYGAVVVWLPRTLTDDEQTLLPWPAWGRFAVVVVALSLGLLARFVVDFAGARALYGVVAAVHAWIEWPVLVCGLAGVRRATGTALHDA